VVQAGNRRKPPTQVEPVDKHRLELAIQNTVELQGEWDILVALLRAPVAMVLLAKLRHPALLGLAGRLLPMAAPEVVEDL
jgi:hypothetical protein